MFLAGLALWQAYTYYDTILFILMLFIAVLIRIHISRMFQEAGCLQIMDRNYVYVYDAIVE